MENNDTHKLKSYFTLALILLNAWKGYDFAILDELKEQGLIDFSYKAKSLYIFLEGEKKAKQLVEKFKQVV